ncbi:MAG: hypothetical protein EOP06_02830 [Proteobacteria bacterium]|nr:MAG: hypothetical protein EOP06_02830 [Pseudomonadota bacterium]
MANKLGIKSVIRLINITLDGDLSEMSYSLELENDLRILWAKDFWQKWSEKVLRKDFSARFKSDSFNGQDNRALYTGEFYAEGVYLLTFEDDSMAAVSYEVGDDQSGNEGLQVEDRSGEFETLAADFCENWADLDWNTEDLDLMAG